MRIVILAPLPIGKRIVRRVNSSPYLLMTKDLWSNDPLINSAAFKVLFHDNPLIAFSLVLIFFGLFEIFWVKWHTMFKSLKYEIFIKKHPVLWLRVAYFMIGSGLILLLIQAILFLI